MTTGKTCCATDRMSRKFGAMAIERVTRGGHGE